MIGIGQRGTMAADGIEFRQLGHGEHAAHFRQLGIKAGQFRRAGSPETEVAHPPQGRDQVGIATVDQPAFTRGKGLGGVHRIDHGKWRACAEILAPGIATAERGSRIDDHRHAIAPGQPGIAIKIEAAPECRIRHDRRHAGAMTHEQALFHLGIRGPGLRIDIVDQRRQAGPFHRLGRGGKGKGRHQCQSARTKTRPGSMPKGQDQAQRGIADGQAIPLPAKQLCHRRGFERPHRRPAITENATLLDRRKLVGQGAEARGIGGNKWNRGHRRASLAAGNTRLFALPSLTCR